MGKVSGEAGWKIQAPGPRQVSDCSWVGEGGRGCKGGYGRVGEGVQGWHNASAEGLGQVAWAGGDLRQRLATFPTIFPTDFLAIAKGNHTIAWPPV